MISAQESEQLRLLYKGRLSQPDMDALKQKLAENPDFRTEAREFLQIIHQIKTADSSRQTIKTILANNDAAMMEQAPVKIAFLLKWSMSVAIMAGIAFSVWYFSIDRPPFTLTLIDEPSIISHQQRGAGEFSPAELSYNQKKYKAAAQQYFQSFQKKPDSLEFLYNYGVSSYKSKNWTEAQKAFQKVARSSFEQQKTAELYWALSLVRAKKRVEGERILTSIAQDEEHPKQVLAKKILQQLKKN